MILFDTEDGTGRSTATSYVSVAQADDIAVLNIHNYYTWLTLGVVPKERLLMYASQILDSRTTWVGTKKTTTQALQWPRTGVVDRYGNAISASSVPYNVIWATLEFAKFSQASDKLALTRPENALSEVKVDTITLKFVDPSSFAIDQFRTPEIVTELLRGLGSVRNSIRRITFGKVLRT